MSRKCRTTKKSTSTNTHKDTPRPRYNGHPIPGLVRQPLELYQPEETGLTFEQEREQWLQTAKPETFESITRDEIQAKVSKYHRDKYICNGYAHTISRLRPRDTTAGVYPDASEAFHVQVAKAREQKGDTPDSNAIEMLAKNQPFRQAITAAFNDGQQPVSTYGPMQLPQSYDPVAALEADPEPEPRPTHWEPGAPVHEMIAGTLHDFGNYLTALVARQLVAIGFTPDTEAIANARSLARTIKDFQKVVQIEEYRRAGKRRKASPGRPPQTHHP